MGEESETMRAFGCVMSDGTAAASTSRAGFDMVAIAPARHLVLEQRDARHAAFA
jgi:hypothetical protein